LCADAFERQHLEIMRRCKFQKFHGGETHTVPGIDFGAAMLKAAELQNGQCSGLHHAARFAEVGEHDIPAGDVLEHGVGV